MIFNSAKEVDANSKKIFGITSFTSLVSLNNRIRLELGGEFDFEERVTIAIHRATSVLNDIFFDRPIWLRLVSWDHEIDLVSLKLAQSDSIQFKKRGKGNTIFYIYYPAYSSDLIAGIIKSIIGFDLGLEDGLNINCLYFNYEIPAVVNIYDDRGMDILVLDKEVEMILKEKYSELITF
ncbi:DUF3885 domain-containing protein [Spirosoma areae]